MIYFWSMDESRKSTARMMSMNNNLVCTVFRSLEDACSADIATNPFIPFGGTAVVKWDESKFNHKAKISYYTCFWYEIVALSNLVEFFDNWFHWSTIVNSISITEEEELQTCGSLESSLQQRGLVEGFSKWWRAEIVRCCCRFSKNVYNRAVKFTLMTGGPAETWGDICLTTSSDIALLSTQIISWTQ